MGKTKKLDEVFKLKKELRECHETITTLEKQLLRYQKEQTEPKLSKEDKKLAKKLEKELVEQKNKCPKCNNGDLVISDLGVRILTICSKKCGYRSVVKHVKEEAKES